MSSNILDVKDLRVRFYNSDGVTYAVNGVSLTLEKGETLAIVGESGCGKSVTSLSFLQLLNSKTGKIEPGSSIKLNGEELVGLPLGKLRKIRGNKIAMIFQDPMTSLNPVMKIGRQIIEPLRLHRNLKRKEAYTAATEMLHKVGIASSEKCMKQYPHELSGGMRQRVMIAMALSCAPDVLIADEPTTALDVTIQAQILDLMMDLKRDYDTSIILITHDLGVVADMAENILVMYAGTVVEYSDKYSLFKNPLHPYTEGLLASIPRLDKDTEKLHSIDGMVPDLRELPKGCCFCPRCVYAKSICSKREPEAYTVDNRSVRCFKYSGEWEGME